MPYTPPAGNAVNFTDANSAIYSPPPATSVNFTTYGTSYFAAAYASLSLSGSATTQRGANTQASGQLTLGGSGVVEIPQIAYGTGVLTLGGSLVLSIPFAGIASGSISLSGTGSADHVQPHFDIVGKGALKLGGAAYDKGFLYVGAGPILLTGASQVALGNKGAASGKLLLKGSAVGSTGYVITGSTKIALSGSATGKRGQAGQGSGVISFGGAASLTYRALTITVGSGQLRLVGAAEIPNAPDFTGQYVYVQSKQRVVYAIQ